MATPDIGLSFAIWLHQTRKSVFKQLIFCKKSLNNVSIWDIGESGGFFHRYDNQHEKYSYTNHEYPASRHYCTQYFYESELPLHRPVAYNFINDKKQYPLKETYQIFRCPNCGGSGRVTCSSCGGSGTVTVHTTNSKGESETQIATCSSCGGSGRQTCGRCSGEGQLLSYTSKDYIWKHTVDKEPVVLPTINRRSVRGLIRKTHEQGGSYPIENFSKQDIFEATQVYNERLESLIQYACDYAQTKEEEINQRCGIVLFQKRQRFYIPLGFINVLINQKFGQFFVAGNLTYQKSHSPPMRWSLLKFLGWFALGISLSLGIGYLSENLILEEKFILWIILSLGMMLDLALVRFVLDFFLKWPQRWVIADDDGLGGWLLIHLLVQTLSYNRQGKLSDLCYTDLFHLPKSNTRKSRHSFFCTIEIKEEKQRKQTELFLASQRALTLFKNDLETVIEFSHTLVWVLHPSTVIESDQRIADLLQNQTPENLAKMRLIIIVNAQKSEVSINQFTQSQKYLKPSQILIHSICLLSAFQQLQQGQLLSETKTTFNQLIKLLEPSTQPSVEALADHSTSYLTEKQ